MYIVVVFYIYIYSIAKISIYLFYKNIGMNSYKKCIYDIDILLHDLKKVFFVVGGFESELYMNFKKNA